MSEWIEKSLSQHAEALKNKEYSAEELTAAYLDAITSRDREIGAYLTVTADAALSAARESDKRRASGKIRGVLDGIPCAVKDNICTKGILTTCASNMLKNYVPPYSATVVEKLEQAGAVLLGKLNMDEFAMGSSTEYSAMKLTRNPHDLARVPGGSSGGSAAAVAAREAVYTLGSDTGGSIRQPSSFCGTVGMKPTYGRVSRYGLVAFASSLDQIGPISQTVWDNAAVLGAIVGQDLRDATTAARTDCDFTADLEKGARGLKIGLPKELFGDGIDFNVKQAVLSSAEQYRAMGAELVSVSLPSAELALEAYYILSSAEASSNLARFDGVRYGHRTESYCDLEELYRRSRSEGFGKEVKRRIMLGTFALSAGYSDAYYKKSLRVRSLIRSDFFHALEVCDLLLSPVAPTAAYPIGEKQTDPTQMYAGDLCTALVNLAGLPALSLPCLKTVGGLPVGVQLIGRAFSESLLYRAAYALEQSGKEGGD